MRSTGLRFAATDTDRNGGTIDQVLLAIPSLTRSERRRIVDRFQRLGIPMLQVPSVDDLTSGRARIDALRPIAIEDLLGRDEVPPAPQLLGPGILDAVVCVTGAGARLVRAVPPDPGVVAGALDPAGAE